MIRHAFISALWAGLIALDITGFGPWLISQPMIVGPLFGWLMGHIATGIVIGGIAQLLWMDVTPVGVGIPYDAMAVTVLSIYWATLPPYGSLSQIVLALMLAVPFGSVFRRMDQWSRRLNARLAHRIESTGDEHLAVALKAGIAAGLVWNFLRYALTYFVVMLAGTWAWTKFHYFPKDTLFDRGLTMAVILLPVAGMSVTLDLFLSEEPDARWLARLGFKTGPDRSKAKRP